MKKHNFNRAASVAVAAAFLLTSFIPQTVFCARELPKDSEILNSVREAVPKSAGYVTEHNIVSQDGVLIYIQDLHCNPGVQKNISDIISSLDKNIGVDKVILEGVPAGKVESNVLTALPESVKYGVVEKLLGKGLLTGAELYCVESGKNNIYGVENWDKYVGNLQRAADLIAVSRDATANVRPFKNAVLKKTKKNLDTLGELASFKRDDNWYDKLSEAEIKYSEPFYKYRNLSGYMNLRQLSSRLDLDKVKKELDLYTQELKNTLSYKNFNNIVSKANNRIEYYKAVYAAAASGDFVSFVEQYPNLYMFLAYSIKSSAVNPILVFYDEETYVNKIINSSLNDKSAFEDLLLLRMTSLLDSYLSLNMTDGEFGYFSENEDLYKALIVRKFPRYADLVLAYLNNPQYDRYYRTNIERNCIFFDNLSKEINRGGKINVFISGGFHTSLIEEFKKKGLSYVLVTPVVLEDFNSAEVYNRLIEINSSVPRVLRNALNPIPFMLAAFPGVPHKSRQAYLSELINSIVNSSQDYRRPSQLRSVIEEWGKRISGVSGSEIEVSYDESVFRVKMLDQILELKIAGGLVDFKESELFVPKTSKYKYVTAALKAAGDKFTPFSPSAADYAQYLALRAVNKAEYMSMKVSGDFYSKLSKRKQDKWAFRFMKLFYRLNLKETAKSIVSSMAWLYTKGSNITGAVKQTTVEVAGRRINLIIEGGFDLSDEELIEIINNARRLPRGEAPIENIPDTLYIGMLDSSSHLFENYTGVGFIGVNKAIYDIGKQDEFSEVFYSYNEIEKMRMHAQNLRKIIFKLGLTHEISHEFLGDVSKEENESFENLRLMQDIAYLINEMKKMYPMEMMYIDGGSGEHNYNEKIKEKYILPYLRNILGGSRFLKRLKGYKLTLDEMIDFMKEKPLSDSDIRHLEETFFTVKTDKSPERKNNEAKFFSSIVLSEKKKIPFKESAFAEDKKNNLKIMDNFISIKNLVSKFEEILYSTGEYEEREISRMTKAFLASFNTGQEILYYTLPDDLFERFFNDRTMVSEHGLKHSTDILSYMLDILAHDKDSLRNLTNKNIKLMVYSALFHDISTIISRGNHEENSAVMAKAMLKTFNDADLDENDIEELANICRGHKKVDDDSKLRPEHSNYFACLLHDADAFSAVLELDRIYDVWVNIGNAVFYNKDLTVKQRIKLLKENNFMDGDAINDLIRQGYYRRKPYLYITEGAKAIIISNQSKQYLIDYLMSKVKEIEMIHNGKYKKSDIGEMIDVINAVIDELNPKLLQQEMNLEDRTSSFTLRNRIFILWQMIKNLFGSKNISFPKNIYMSDVHGGYGRLVDLLMNVLNIETPAANSDLLFAGADDENAGKAQAEVLYKEKTKRILSVLETGETDVNAIYVGGDMVDRGGGQLKTLDLMAHIAKAGKLRFVMGNHDIWCAMNIQGIHLPYYRTYQGIDAGYEDMYGNVKELLISSIDIDEKARKTGLGEYIPRNYAVDKYAWAARLAEYMDNAAANQKNRWNAKYKEMCAVFEQTYGYTLDDKGKDVLNNPEGIFKEDDNLRRFWGLVLGRNVGVTVYTGLRAADKMSVNWWKDKKEELARLREKYSGKPKYAAAFDALDGIMSEIIESQIDKMREEVGKNKNWMWRVIDAMMYRNYESVEWWAMDWAFHDSWGGGSDGLIAQRNMEIEERFRRDNDISLTEELTDDQNRSLSRMLLTGANYLQDNRIQDIGRFFKNNFFLYRRDEYGTYMMHSMLPIDEDGDVAIGRVVNGKIEKYDENGKRIKGFYFRGEHYYGKSLMKGLDVLAAALRKNDWNSQAEALILINSWYADLTTEIKPDDISKKHHVIGFEKILSRMGRGIMRLTVGHNPVSKSKSKGLHSVEFAGAEEARIVLSIDEEFSERYAKPMGKGTIHIHRGDIGIISTGFESGDPNAVIVADIVVSKKQFLRSVLYDISKPLADITAAAFNFFEDTVYNLYDFFKSRLYKTRSVWDNGNTLVINVIRDMKEEKNIQHYNTNILSNKKVNIIGIELKETDISADNSMYSDNNELAESERKLYKTEKMRVAVKDGEFIEIPVSFMYRKIRRNGKITDYVGVYVGFEAKKIINANALEFNDELKNRILYAATAAFIEQTREKGNRLQKMIGPVNAKRKIIMRTYSITDFDNALTEEHRRGMDGVLVARDGVSGRGDSDEVIEEKFLNTLASAFGSLAFSNFYILKPAASDSVVERVFGESVNDTKATADMLAAA